MSSFVDGKIILKWILKIQNVDCIQMTQDGVQWWALLKTVLNLWFP
jgi:hypothetical protein